MHKTWTWQKFLFSRNSRFRVKPDIKTDHKMDDNWSKNRVPRVTHGCIKSLWSFCLLCVSRSDVRGKWSWKPHFLNSLMNTLPQLCVLIICATHKRHRQKGNKCRVMVVCYLVRITVLINNTAPIIQNHWVQLVNEAGRS